MKFYEDEHFPPINSSKAKPKIHRKGQLKRRLFSPQPQKVIFAINKKQNGARIGKINMNLGVLSNLKVPNFMDKRSKIDSKPHQQSNSKYHIRIRENIRIQSRESSETHEKEGQDLVPNLQSIQNMLKSASKAPKFSRKMTNDMRKVAMLKGAAPCYIRKFYSSIQLITIVII